MGYHYRYGDLQSALNDLLSKPPSVFQVSLPDYERRYNRLMDYLKSYYIYQQYVVIEKRNPVEILLKTPVTIASFFAIYFTAMYFTDQMAKG